MAEQRTRWARLIPDLIVLGLLLASIIASLCLWFLGNWAEYGWWLMLTLRIIWGCWIVACLATVLTKVTIFGWSFRKYFRWPGEGRPPDPGAPRPTRAPWVKSAAASFSFTVAMVSVTGAIVVAWAVIFILKGVIGDWVYWLVSMILGTVWWVTMVTLVLVRVAVFGAHRKRALREQADKGGPHPEPPGPHRQPQETSTETRP
jgi:hypothetical protein